MKMEDLEEKSSQIKNPNLNSDSVTLWTKHIKKINKYKLFSGNS